MQSGVEHLEERKSRYAGRSRRRQEAARSEVPLAHVQALDERLYELALGAGRDRLTLGTLLDRLATNGQHHELGYSSLEAYGLQVCGRSGRWMSESRTLAKRLSALPVLRRALVSGHIGWSMAELVARHATVKTDAAFAALATQSTVRQMRALLAAASEREASGQMPALDAAQHEGDQTSASVPALDAALPEGSQTSAPALDAALPEGSQTSAGVESGAAATEPPAPPSGPVGQMSARMLAAAEADSTCALSVTLERKDALMLAWTHRFFEHLVGSRQSADFFLEAMVAEASDALSPDDHDRLLSMEGAAAGSDARRLAWLAQLEAWREESERRCERNIPQRAPRDADEPTLDGDLHERIVELAAKMTAREVELARAALAFRCADGWRRLRYASFTQYATERLGVGVSSLKAKVALARRLHEPVRNALEAGQIGYVAALALARVATPETAVAWVERARARTVKHLRQEVDVAAMLGQAAPPSDAQVRHVQQLETRILQGDRTAMEPEGQTSAGPPVCLRLRVTRDTARALRCFESVVGPRLGVSLMRFLCDRLWDAWKHVCQHDEKWAHIYARDRYECSSPVCSRHDVTPHHIRFVGRGGSDDDENLAGLCLWCHLEGIHGGRIELTGTADAPVWTLGREHALRVEGRQLLESSSGWPGAEPPG